MIKLNIIKDILVFLLVYIPPLIIFARFWREKDRSTIILIVITLLYIAGSMYTQNLLPFILVVFDIKYIKYSSIPTVNERLQYPYEESRYKRNISSRVKFDYERFKFGWKNFNILFALKFAAISYIMSMFISVFETILLSRIKVELQEQEVVSWMTNMPLWKFIVIIPIIIIFAPVVEEFVFRWLFFEKIFKDRIGIYLSALLSSIIFGFVHFNLRSFPILVWIGIYNCYLIDKKGYWYSVFNHFTFNFITTVALLIEKI